MCTGGNLGASDDAREPAEQVLADLMARHLGSPVDPVALREFIQSYWTKITVLAHKIHETPQPDYSQQGGHPYRQGAV